jgi:hypothetical protein
MDAQGTVDAPVDAPQEEAPADSFADVPASEASSTDAPTYQCTGVAADGGGNLDAIPLSATCIVGETYCLIQETKANGSEATCSPFPPDAPATCKTYPTCGCTTEYEGHYVNCTCTDTEGVIVSCGPV